MVAALTMVATFPGRTHGLGFITEAILYDLLLDRVVYGHYNLWATLIGALFCLPIGAMLDKYGCRNVLAATLALLGVSVIEMSLVRDPYTFFFTLVLTRGFGQSALSVASITLISKYFPKERLGLSMGIYSILTSLFFMVAFGGMKTVLDAGIGWRTAWGGIGVILLAVYLPMVFFCVRKHEPVPVEEKTETGELEGVPFSKAICTQEFWLFALSISFFGLVSSGIGLYNQDILNERGFDAKTYRSLMVVGVPFGLLSNLMIGVLVRYVRISYLLAFSLFFTGLGKLLFPFIQTQSQVYAYTMILAFAGGGLSVLFFIVWADIFGKRDVGRIQGAAQMLTVFASAVGPILFAYSKEWTHSYTPAFWISGGLTIAFAIWACLLPKRNTSG